MHVDLFGTAEKGEIASSLQVRQFRARIALVQLVSDILVQRTFVPYVDYRDGKIVHLKYSP